MKSAVELYPDLDKEPFYGPCDYQPIIDDIGAVVLQQDDQDCQGDTRVLYRDGKRWGWLQFGWGSCSGCDALQACQTVSELQELIDDTRASVRWFDSRAEALKFFEEHDWKGDYSWHEKEQAAFVEGAIAKLKEDSGT